jgi:hypothetical protein
MGSAVHEQQQIKPGAVAEAALRAARLNGLERGR